MNSRLEFNTNLGKIESKTSASRISYKLDRSTSSTYVEPFLQTAESNAIDLFTEIPTERQVLKDANYESTFTNLRYSFASSIEYNFEQSFSYTNSHNHSFLIGGKYGFGDGGALTNFLAEPIDDEEDIPIGQRNNNSYDNLSIFGQVYFDFKKLKLMLDWHYGDFTRFELSEAIFNFSPRVAALYTFHDKLRVRASASIRALRAPVPYYSANTIVRTDANTTNELNYSAENSNYVNIGLNWKVSAKTIFDVDLYSQRIDNLINYVNLLQTDSNGVQLINGYGNFGNTKSINGIQLFLRSQDVLSTKDLSIDASIDISTGSELFVQSSALSTPSPALVDSLDRIRAFPRFIGKLNFSFKPTQNLHIRIQNTILGKSTPYSFGNVTRFGKTYLGDGGWITDIAARFQLNRNFGVYGKASNIFNSNHAGIDANESFDVLRYNPQQQINIKLGIDYIIK